jgi:arginine decarboxylase
MNSPIYNAIIEHNKKNRSAFHMPAHKGAAECLAPLASVLPFDMTEIPDTGSLFDGEGVTAEAEQLAAELFGAAGSFMSAGGCTLCIQAMLRLAAPQGGKVICGRVIHRAAVNAMALLDITPVWVLPDDSAGEGFAGRITAAGVRAALVQNPDAKAVYITSPDYYGVMSDIAGISAAAKEYGVPVLVDNAHGAHLKFIDDTLSSLSRGAAMSADSAHKTLPVLTGGAWLHIAEPKYLDKARDALSLFGSTSPSYLIMLSLDLCRAWLAEHGRQELGALAAETDKIKKFALSGGFMMPQGECDPLRLAFNTQVLGVGGKDAGDILRKNGIEPEYAGPGGVILIPSPFNTGEDFERLAGAVQKISERFEQNENTVFPAAFSRQLPAAVLTPKQALFAQKERVEVKSSAGRIACGAVSCCPPAIPVVVPGEIITAQSVHMLQEYGFSHITVVK